MGNTKSDRLSGRVSVRTHEWVEEKIEDIANSSTWASESHVSRDMFEMGIISHEIATTDYATFEESPVSSWERPQGEYPDDDKLVCPECVNSNKHLFRLRQAPLMNDVVGVQCLVCGLTNEPDSFKGTLTDNHYWARSGPHEKCHIVDGDSHRTLCGLYNDEGLDTFGTPDRDGRPTYIHDDCWKELITNE